MERVYVINCSPSCSYSYNSMGCWIQRFLLRNSEHKARLKPYHDTGAQTEIRASVVHARKNAALDRIVCIQHMKETDIDLLWIFSAGDYRPSAFE